jgi:hypothetical protein
MLVFVKRLHLPVLSVGSWPAVPVRDAASSYAQMIRSKNQEGFTVQHAQFNNDHPQPAQILPIDQKLLVIDAWIKQFERFRAAWNIRNDFGAYDVYLSVPGYVYRDRCTSLLSCVDQTIAWIKEIEEKEKEQRERSRSGKDKI